VGTAIVTALGLDEFAAADEDAYVACAAALASDLERLEKLRVGMRERILKSQLCDEFAFARAMERAYRQAWQAWCEKQH
jgi:predicted O-linked N-acetylglucosamine transferase (SPINDLY family)